MVLPARLLKRRGIVALAVVALVGASSACRSPLLAQPKEVVLGQNFELRPGEIAPVPAARLRVGFDAVVNDSRCPKGEQCIRAGEATIRVWLQKGSEARDVHEVRTTEADNTASFAEGYTLRLLRLDPYPVAGRTTRPSDYVATLVVTSGASPSDAVR